MEKNKFRHLLFVCGLSGAGKTVTLKSLQEIGFDILDYAPLDLISNALQGDYFTAGQGRVAIGAGVSTLGFDPEKFLALATEARQNAENVTVLFLDCDEETVLSRYAQTRLRHPLARDGAPSDAIGKEREMLAEIALQADLKIDTTRLSPRDLRVKLEDVFSERSEHINRPVIILQSFGFKYGLPRNADTVWDVRFLDNPYWSPALRPLTGKDERVGEYIQKDEKFAELWEKMTDMALFLVNASAAEGKQYYHLGIGCTGGRHRSVYVVERLKEYFTSAGYTVAIRHENLTTERRL